MPGASMQLALKSLVAPNDAAVGVGPRRLSAILSFYNSRLISGLSYKTAFSNELLTSIFPL